MIVRLTIRQRARVGELVAARLTGRVRESFVIWWVHDYTVASKHRVDTVMPAVAWKVVEEEMFDHCFDERGFRSHHVRTTDLNAYKSIRRGLNAREFHPAMSRRGALGHIAEIIPAWERPQPDDTGRVYSPYPIIDARFVILAPETRTVNLQTTTLWVEMDAPPDRLLYVESEHLTFT